MLLDVEDPLFVKFGHAFLNEVNFQLSYSLLLELTFTCLIFSVLFVAYV